MADELCAASGLQPHELRSLYRSPTLLGAGQGPRNILHAILDGDPHKETIMTRRSPGGPMEPELISGR